MTKRRKDDSTKKMFRDPSGQVDFIEQSYEEELEAKRNQPVSCLGMDFPNDDARREYFLGELAEKLKEPEFRKIEGFPIGEDEDILTLSDPPYYTACPNPWLGEFVKHFGERFSERTDTYHREPFAADVREGKNQAIYNAHSYHTKVPHRAIMRYILHYTEPGDLIFDGFCGTGMTGVAAKLCGDHAEVQALGYRVSKAKALVDERGERIGKVGERKAILSDLSPAATFIAATYNGSPPVSSLLHSARSALEVCEKELADLYTTTHPADDGVGTINYTVWTDVFSCPECNGDVRFWDVAVDLQRGAIRDSFDCPQCGSELTKRSLTPKEVTEFDPFTNTTVKQIEQCPAFIVYSYKGKRYQKQPNAEDFRKAQIGPRPEDRACVPTSRIPEGDKTGEPIRAGLTHLHHFYTPRNLAVIAMLRNSSGRAWAPFSALTPRATRMHRIAASRLGGPKKGEGGATVGIINGTLYVPSLSVEMNVLEQAKDRIATFQRALICGHGNIISTESTTQLASLPNNCLDYAFLDPPFGANLMYSELNLLWEGWLRVTTNAKDEAIENKTQRKLGSDYKRLMGACFSQVHRCLKPGRWVTVEFSNTKASVWNTIQSALQEAGFVVANVAALDKKQGSFNAVTNTTSVKQDLVISAYKPSGGFEDRFETEAQTDEGVWSFVRSHMKYLPVTKSQGESAQPIPERDPRILYDQLVAYFVRRGYAIPVSSQEFQCGLAQRFVERDGMYFLPDQAAEHDKHTVRYGHPGQMSLFVSDEASAIDWLRNVLQNKPQTFSDINPQFMKELGGWHKHEKPLDLRDLLNQNFLCYDGQGGVPEQIHSYLSTNWKDLRNLPKTAPTLIAKARDRWYVPNPNRAGDLEKLRERTLLKEFWEYLPEGYKPKAGIDNQDELTGLVDTRAKVPMGKRMKIIRTEAVRVGFRRCWQNQDYRTIIAVAKRIPEDVLQEDPKLLMWYDQALTRTGEE